MKRRNFTFSAMLAVMLTGCSSTDQTSSFSTGGKLLINTKISNVYDLNKYIEAQTKAASISQETNNPLVVNDNPILTHLPHKNGNLNLTHPGPC